ncbi:MAG TPA: Trm112 family protein [Chthoniobacterales bacterium]
MFETLLIALHPFAAMDETLLELLCAPGSRAALRLATPDELAEINNRIQMRLIRNRDGSTLGSELDGSLICESERSCYPIRDGMPVLLAGEAFEWPNIP